MNTANLDHFTGWVKKPAGMNAIGWSSEKRAVLYTRVSSKEQHDKNLSLDWQRKTIDEFATRNQFNVLECFGGTFESAKTDGRKEFVRMLDYIRSRKGKVSHILVYLLDRFSRTGGGAIKLAKDLREKYGVTIIAVTQPIDTSNPGGVFQQNMQFLFSEYDNQLRRQRAMAGIKEKLCRGIWCLKPPMGYDIIRSEGSRNIVVNAVGKKLRKAFEWKATGMKNDEILKRLQAMGVKIYKQKLSMIFSNPFYCGILVNRMLDGKLVEGTHEKLISHELFLSVNQVRKDAKGKYGVTHQKEQDALPLKLFVKCDNCGKPFTGYIVKSKNINYYKCRTIGCRCNKNAKKLNEAFTAFISSFSVQPHLIAPLKEVVYAMVDKHTASSKQQVSFLKNNHAQIQKKIDGLEEKYYSDNAMPRETYDKLALKLSDEKIKILDLLAGASEDSSNLKTHFDNVLEISMKLATVWTSSSIGVKEKLQKLIFPAGVYYNVKKEAFRTEEIKEVFRYIPQLNCITDDDKNRQGSISAALSSLVGKTGFEPATLPTKVGMRYRMRKKKTLDYSR
ncbi:MAG: recombinase family protein, partial [Chitinophagaceae bacterium]